MARFLLKADSYHGVWPHFLNGDTGRTIPFSRKDDGGDLVETSFLIAGLLCARQYFDGADEAEARLRAAIDWMWREVEWDWHTRDGRNVLYLALEPEQRLEHEPRDPRLERVPDHLRARRLRPALRDLARGLPPRLGRGPRLRATAAATTASRCRSARTAAARCFSRTIPSSASTRAASATAMPTTGSRTSPTRASTAPTASDNPEGLPRLRPGLLGPDRERQRPRLRRPLPDQRPRRHQPDRGARLLPLHAGGVDAARCGTSTTTSATGSGASTASSTPSARPPAGTRTPTSPSTRGRSS